MHWVVALAPSSAQGMGALIRFSVAGAAPALSMARFAAGWELAGAGRTSNRTLAAMTNWPTIFRLTFIINLNLHMRAR